VRIYVQFGYQSKGKVRIRIFRLARLQVRDELESREGKEKHNGKHHYPRRGLLDSVSTEAQRLHARDGRKRDRPICENYIAFSHGAQGFDESADGALLFCFCFFVTRLSPNLRLSYNIYYFGGLMAKKVLDVKGMSCEHCVKAVTTAAQSVSGVSGVSVSLEKGTVAFDYADEGAVGKVIAAIVDEGYEAA
jgi:copper chaperone CopZ